VSFFLIIINSKLFSRLNHELTAFKICEGFNFIYSPTHNTADYENDFNYVNHYSSCLISNNDYNGKDVLFKLEKFDDNRTWHVSIFNNSPVNLDMFLFKDCPFIFNPMFTGNQNDDCVLTSTNGLNFPFVNKGISGYNYDVISIRTPGIYYIIVDGINSSQEAEFTIDVGCDRFRDEDFCEIEEVFCDMPILGDTRFTFAGSFIPTSTVNFYNLLPWPERGSLSGFENLYKFTAPVSGNYRIEMNPLTSEDLDLFILSNVCNPGSSAPNQSVYTCLGLSNQRAGIPEEVILTLSEGEEIFIVVDGFLFGEGEFTLLVECAGDVCMDAIPVNCDQNYNGNFNDASSLINRYACTGQGQGIIRYEDPEVIYTFTPTTSGVYRFNAVSEFGPSPAILLSDCCNVESSSEPLLQCGLVACANSTSFGVTTLEVSLIAGQTYYVFVEKKSQASSNGFMFWINCDCNLFKPLDNQEGHFHTFRNNSGGTYVSHTIKFPFDPPNGDYTYADSTSMVNPDGTITGYFPYPGCYEVCFYYRVNNQLIKCCFKYCPIIKNYDCFYPYIEGRSMTETGQNLFIECELEATRSIQNFPQYCRLTIRNTATSTSTEYNTGIINLPEGEYEVCCWKFDPECHTWNVCCEIICVPFIPKKQKDCASENIITEQLPNNEYKFTWTGSPVDLEWSIMPNVAFNANGNMMNVKFPSTGRYKVCGIGQINEGGVILRDTCCQYICIDDVAADPCENSFIIRPIPNNRVRLICTGDRPVIRWEITYLPIPTGITLSDTLYGNDVILQLLPGTVASITKVYAGCCGMEMRCHKTICNYDPFDCNLIMPRYLGTASNPQLHYEFSVPAGYLVKEWRIDELDLVIGTNTNIVSHTFSQPGCYTISALIYDPETGCYIICCKRICIDNPFNCNLLRYWFTGDESNPYTYDIRLFDDCFIPTLQFNEPEIKWFINGEYRSEFDGLGIISNIDLSSFGPPGSDIVICVMFYDPCLKACRWCCFKITLDPPFNCNVFTPVFIDENNYSFTALGNFEASYWSIGGLEGLVFNENSSSFDLSDPIIQELIINTKPDYIYVYFYYRLNNCWKVCCIKVCLRGPDKCDKFGDECDYFLPIYNEDFENGPPLGFGYMEGDSININMDWWKGEGVVVDGRGSLSGDDILCLSLKHPALDSVQIFKVTFDFESTWFRNLATGAYFYTLDGTFLLCKGTVDTIIGFCALPDLAQILDNNPNLLQFCGGGADLVFCTHKVEILIDRSGPIQMFIDGRRVNYTDPTGNNWQNLGAEIDKINFGKLDTGFDFFIDNICIAECKSCDPPVIDKDIFMPCDRLVFRGFGSSSDSQFGAFYEYNGNEEGEGWIIKELVGDDLITVFESNSPSPQFFFPGFRPGRTYFVCYKYLDENGCVQYCCHKVFVPANCAFFSPFFRGDDNTLRFDFVLEEENPDGLELMAWYIGDQLVQQGGNSFSWVFPAPGVYYVYCVFWDPIKKCYVWCCRKICVDFPLNCDQIIIDYDGSTNEYILFASGVQQVISWNIDIPAGLPNNGFIGSDNPQRFNPADFGILPGQEIIISVRYIDADGCIKICCRRLCVPINSPLAECDNIFEELIGPDLVYRFFLDPAQGFEQVQWRLHIPGTNITINIGSGNISDIVDFIELTALYPSLDLRNICISIFYFDPLSGCWRVCCKCFCLLDPSDCDKFGDECDYFLPIYNEDFENGPPLGFGYMEGDSININMDWWKGEGVVVDGRGSLSGDDILCLSLKHPALDSVQIFKVTFDFESTWFRNLATGAYFYTLDGTFLLCKGTVDTIIGFCALPDLAQILDNNPNLLQFCGGGADLVFCTHKVEILIDRSGPIQMFIDGRRVNYTDPTGNNWQNLGAEIDKINFGKLDTGFDFFIDNICIAECKSCDPPVIDKDNFMPCDRLVFRGFGSSSDSQFGAFYEYNGNEEGEGWVIKELVGDDLITVFESNSPSPQFFFPGFRPGRTYFVCYKYLDENGCIQYCCHKVFVPANCDFFSPFFRGDDNTLRFDFVLEEENPDGLELMAWYIGDQLVQQGGNSFSWVFPAPGVYYVYCVFWDPIKKCYVWCCRKICVDFPLNCDQIIVDYDGSTNEYILFASGVQQVISWNIDIPTGLPNNGFIGSDNPQRFNPADFGILPGQEIIISVRYIDADGCIKICCRRLCVPAGNPLDECSNIFPEYLGSGINYRLILDPSEGFTQVLWRLHIPGSDEVIEIGSGLVSDDIDFEVLLQEHPALSLDRVCISIFYFDTNTNCWRVCSKCFCIADSPFDCTSILYYYSGTPEDRLIYDFDLQVDNAEFIEWKIDETNTVISNERAFQVNFADFNHNVGDQITVTVRYFDPISQCFRICCKVLCLNDPYALCNAFIAGPVVDDIIDLSTTVTNPIWTIEGLAGVYSTQNQVELNLTDPNIATLIIDQSTINVCVTYMENGCCRVCCREVCVISSAIDCNDFNIDFTAANNEIVFNFEDANPTAIDTRILLPSGMLVILAGDIESYTNTIQGDYRICRRYLSSCEDTISCCQDFCIAFEINCEPFVFTVDPDNDRIFSFTHNIIGGQSYLWDFGDGTTSTSSLTTVSHTYSEENQVYSVCLTVTDACGEECVQCRDIEVGSINFSPVLVHPDCENTDNGSISLNISGGFPPIEIIWNTGATSQSIEQLGPGMYSVTIIDGMGRDTSFTFELIAPPLPVLNVDIMHTSCGEENGSIEISVSNDVGIVNVEWIPPGISDTLLAQDLDAGEYGVVITDVNGCISTLTGLIVNESQGINPLMLGDDRSACPGDTITLDVGVVDAANVQITWRRDGEQMATQTRLLNVFESGLYTVQLSNNENCDITDSIAILFFPDNMVFPESRTGFLVGDILNLSVEGAVNVEWFSVDADLSCTSCIETSVEIFGTAELIIVATDENGCTIERAITLSVSRTPISGPNYITPNGDGFNDFLEFINLDRFSQNKLTIFNRWGQIIWEEDNYNNKWDGTINGKDVPDGAYYYVLRFGNESIDQYEIKSDLTIIRKQ
jgi:gliding motility-associated-like protein